MVVVEGRNGCMHACMPGLFGFRRSIVCSFVHRPPGPAAKSFSFRISPWLFLLRGCARGRTVWDNPPLPPLLRLILKTDPIPLRSRCSPVRANATNKQTTPPTSHDRNTTRVQTRVHRRSRAQPDPLPPPVRSENTPRGQRFGWETRSNDAGSDRSTRSTIMLPTFRVVEEEEDR